MKKRVLFFLTLIILPLLLSGCWNRKELGTLSIVQAIGIDRTEDDQISLTVQILKPGEVKGPAGGGGKGTWIVTSTGETVFDAFRNASMEVKTKLYLPHNKVIVIGEETAKAGILPLLDFLKRDHETRRMNYVLIARGKAKDIVKGEHEQEKISAIAIEGLAKATIARSKLPKVNLHELLKTINSKTSDPVVGGIKIVEKKENEKVKKLLELDETAIFKKDKLIGWFDGKKTRGLLWILGEVKSGIIIVKSPKDETKNVSLEIIRASSKLKPEITDGKLSITVEVKEEGNLVEQMSQVDLTKPDTFKELEKKQVAVIEEEISASLSKAQEWGVDIFKFGEAFHRKFPAEWPELEKNWDEEFPKVEVKVVVEAKLRRTGLSTSPIKAEEAE